MQLRYWVLATLAPASFVAADFFSSASAADAPGIAGASAQASSLGDVISEIGNTNPTNHAQISNLVGIASAQATHLAGQVSSIGTQVGGQASAFFSTHSFTHHPAVHTVTLTTDGSTVTTTVTATHHHKGHFRGHHNGTLGLVETTPAAATATGGAPTPSPAKGAGAELLPSMAALAAAGFAFAAYAL